MGESRFLLRNFKFRRGYRNSVASGVSGKLSVGARRMQTDGRKLRRHMGGRSDEHGERQRRAGRKRTNAPTWTVPAAVLVAEALKEEEQAHGRRAGQNMLAVLMEDGATGKTGPGRFKILLPGIRPP